jgi:proteasome alpha subunit
MPFYVPPEQLMSDRAEFAQKGIARGRPIIFLEYAEGILLIGENPGASLHKLGEIYDRVAFAGVGRFNEFESLRVAGVRYADLKGYSYGRTDVTAKGLANAYSQTMGQIFTHEVKPYEVEVVVAEVGDGPSDTAIFRIRYDGNLGTEEAFGAIGGANEELQPLLEAGYVEQAALPDVLRLATASLEAAEERSIEDTDYEAAVLDRTLGRRIFRRVSPEEIGTARG